MTAELSGARKREFKDQIYDAFAGVAKALANGHRLELLDLLSQAERSVEDLARDASMSLANTSQHLQVLRRIGLVDARREGTRAYYRLASRAAGDLCRCLRAFGEAQLPTIDHIVGTYLTDRNELEAISAAELRSRLTDGDGDLILLDVRPANEFAAGHIPGARSLPIDELRERLDELPDGSEIVAYCRGRYCVYADDATRLLREHGFRARRLEMGVADYQLASRAPR